jgi:hypothetical protein
MRSDAGQDFTIIKFGLRSRILLGGGFLYFCLGEGFFVKKNTFSYF